ncbi:YggT family protein [Sphingomonas piscis]|uniref:YggT family protein n=1 Tax=Sphingomonas piscis TaxID=2714943 RepID=A0A6G7YTA4_9SPHN|nr:YggT family protein [Sphingomonas piscis]QIK79969.1 YggT family protein [Sphingomonas piscis]
MLHAIFSVGHLLLNVLWWVVIIQVVLSWLFAFNVLNTSSNGIRQFALAMERLTDPIYRPIRRILPDFGGIDFSPLVLLILLQIGHILLNGVEASLLTGQP